MAYQFPLWDYPGKGAGAGEALLDALFGAPEALLFAPAAGWTGVAVEFLPLPSVCICHVSGQSSIWVLSTRQILC